MFGYPLSHVISVFGKLTAGGSRNENGTGLLQIEMYDNRRLFNNLKFSKSNCNSDRQIGSFTDCNHIFLKGSTWTYCRLLWTVFLVP